MNVNSTAFDNKLSRHFWLVVISLVLAVGLSELLLRMFCGQLLAMHQEERTLLYHYDATLGWFPDANRNEVFIGSHPVHVSSNSRGFRDIEHHVNQKPGIVFIGDSFVWGYDVEARDRFTDRLRDKLSEWNVYNLGVSGYSTDQEWLLLQSQFNYYQPRIVFVVYCTYNDDFGNTSNSIENGWYYKPYFEVDAANNLMLKGVPVPRSLSYFGHQYPSLTKSYVMRLLVNTFSARPVKDLPPPSVQLMLKMNEYVKSKGGCLVVGLTDHHVTLEAAFNNNKIPYVLLTGEAYNTNGFHWTPAGHAQVGTTVYDFLSRGGLLNYK